MWRFLKNRQFNEKQLSLLRLLYIGTCYTIGVIALLPLTMIINRFMPPIQLGDMNIDILASLLTCALLLRLIIWLLKPLIIPATILFMGYLTVNGWMNGYSWGDFTEDYTIAIEKNWLERENKQTDLLTIMPSPLENASSMGTREVRDKVMMKDSLVRNFAVEYSIKYFSKYHNKYGKITRYLSLFKYINNNFNYVHDTYRDEYFASARETIMNGLGGDCDDHSILMASALMSIGAKCRLVVIRGHMYPELFVGSEADFAQMQNAIIELFSDQRVQKLHYHITNGEYWINLDYTARYPGGPYMNNDIRLVINL
ncbi:transglutaminase domain-containing protein [Polluticaenibacter yanchengensis]|uniref:Transglutaminase family protein n=1 Tax=Polluticaenibacter yanchengensis TaxID=3014562 RepID=A0ABT4UI22_9BACT|nr:transglutaminase family protein [Chitinophagaceae bacterium LY-5]